MFSLTATLKKVDLYERSLRDMEDNLRTIHGILKHTNFHWTVAMKSYSYIISHNNPLLLPELYSLRKVSI